MLIRLLTHTRWAYCKICGIRTDQHEITSVKEVWECERCHHLINRRGEPIAN
jgi:uncharacterized paraquat-inducible protein A